LKEVIERLQGKRIPKPDFVQHKFSDPDEIILEPPELLPGELDDHNDKDLNNI